MYEINRMLAEFMTQKKHYLDISKSFPNPKIYDQLIRINTAIEILKQLKGLTNQM